MEIPIIDAINTFKQDAQTIIDTSNTDDLATWEAYVISLDDMLLNDPTGILPDRPLI